jgi:EAL domain-containing protein (putative c-di-GMP-specific phosphodiesterase class I)
MTGFETADLDAAVMRGEIVALFQPQVDLTTDRIVAVEALSRWEHPTSGRLEPAAFIPAAEDSGAISGIGDVMLAMCCDAALGWRDGGTPLDIAINVSIAQMCDPQLFDRLLRTLDVTGVDATSMTVEITESRPISDLPEVARRLDVLRAHGVGVSLDDFGAGFATLEHLDALPVSELKLDKSLVQSSPDDGRLDAAVALANERNLRLVAEGVETEAQRDRVCALGCDRAQGFLFSPPLDVDGVARALSV